MSRHIGRNLFGTTWRSTAQFFPSTGQPGPTCSSSQRTALARRNYSSRGTTATPTPVGCRNSRLNYAAFGFNGMSANTKSPAHFAFFIPRQLGVRHTKFRDSRKIYTPILYAWKRNLHTSEENFASQKSSKDDATNRFQEPSQRSAKSDPKAEPHRTEAFKGGSQQHTPNSHHIYLIDRFSHVRSPTREELLAAATGFWSRLKIRFKWFSIRSVRPFNIDEIGAFFSWVLLGHVLWIFLGTTTFFSLIIFAINTVFAQETLARWVGNYLTKSSGIKVVFESAIVPKWGDGVISFKNVFVSRRPGQGGGNVSKGSSKTAAAAALHSIVPSVQQREDCGGEEEDTNYTQFDVTIDTVNVTLSFTKWFNGKGLLRDVEVKGIRGVVDRTHVYWPDEPIDPKSYRHEHNPGDFEIDSFRMEDVLVTVYQPNNFRPFPVSIFTCHLPQLRRQWLFYDFLSASIMSGSFDNSLFTIHPRQTHSYTGAQLNNGVEENGKPSPWKKHSRIRIDGLNIDHLNRGVEGPFSWIHEGNVDIVADIMFPAENDESLAKVMADFYDRLEATVTSNRYQSLAESLPTNVEDGTANLLSAASKNDKRFVVTDLRIHLNNVRAVVPLFTRDLSYINNALIRPIVAYINSKRTFIPIQCRLVKRVSDFDGSWTIFDSGLMDDLSAETYEAFARDVVDEQARKRRLKKVGLWSLQLAAQAIFMGMAGNIA
uniref:Mitochondrial inner membrane protein Mdm31 n=1 Tax=Coccidioides posadasii RMSCC 3488 TaxID=454284 RepID=A0A0J6FHJ6_COCPO|nr:mitochondrial inner membrane protein Mdm31 [Coccidioides posadasii RMSCC 3488]